MPRNPHFINTPAGRIEYATLRQFLFEVRRCEHDRNRAYTFNAFTRYDDGEAVYTRVSLTLQNRFSDRMARNYILAQANFVDARTEALGDILEAESIRLMENFGNPTHLVDLGGGTYLLGNPDDFLLPTHIPQSDGAAGTLACLNPIRMYVVDTPQTLGCYAHQLLFGHGMGYYIPEGDPDGEPGNPTETRNSSPTLPDGWQSYTPTVSGRVPATNSQSTEVQAILSNAERLLQLMRDRQDDPHVIQALRTIAPDYGLSPEAILNSEQFVADIERLCLQNQAAFGVDPTPLPEANPGAIYRRMGSNIERREASVPVAGWGIDPDESTVARVREQFARSMEGVTEAAFRTPIISARNESESVALSRDSDTEFTLPTQIQVERIYSSLAEEFIRPITSNDIALSYLGSMNIETTRPQDFHALCDRIQVYMDAPHTVDHRREQPVDPAPIRRRTRREVTRHLGESVDDFEFRQDRIRRDERDFGAEEDTEEDIDENRSYSDLDVAPPVPVATNRRTITVRNGGNAQVRINGELLSDFADGDSVEIRSNVDVPSATTLPRETRQNTEEEFGRLLASAYAAREARRSVGDFAANNLRSRLAPGGVEPPRRRNAEEEIQRLQEALAADVATAAYDMQIENGED